MSTFVSYPHPVLGNGDDIATGLIEPQVEYRAADESVVVSIRNLQTSNPTLDALIQNRKASWIVRVQCARTYFRADVTTQEAARDITFMGSDLDGRVEVEIMLFASESITGYAPSGAHADYSGTAFDLVAGEILALGPTFAFDVDKQFDPLRAPVASIMRISKGEHPDGPFRLVLEDEFIEILLSHEDWTAYAGIKDRVSSVLHVALVLPALVEAIRRMDDFRGRRWSDRLFAIIEARQVDLSQPLDAAQVLLQSPLTRAFNHVNAVLDREV